MADNVDWIGERTHRLAGGYRSKADFRTHTFEKLNKVLPQSTQLRVEHALVSADTAVVELRSLATASNGLALKADHAPAPELAQSRKRILQSIDLT